MDHLEEKQEPSSVSQQDQTQQQRRQQQGRSQQSQQQQQQWSQRTPGGYPASQPSHYAASARRPYPAQQDITLNHTAAAAAGMMPPLPRAHDLDYLTPHPGAATVNYPIHQSSTASYAGYPQHYQPPQQMYHQAQIGMQQPLHMQQQQQHMGVPMMEHSLPSQPYIQPTAGRLPGDRPLVKLSVSLIDTYKHINKVYYEERDARRAARAAQKAQKGQGANNNGWDDENFDYIVTNGEMFYGRYIIKERIGKGSFGQVVRAIDTESNKDVAIKIIKSKKPFLMQAKTEIELLSHLVDKDPDDQNNIVRLLTHFMYRNHQCLVFEMLSLNLYELLKNTQFGGVSLNLIRKFAKQILKALSFLARTDVDIIHCDLKPENILLRHPKRSGVKVIDFGSSCRSNKRMYSYIQSRFYRSPEVMLGLPYSVSIDMWSLGCILAEMHTGEPLFSGSDQFDQMQKIVKLLGMIPSQMLEQAGDQHRLQFFERARLASGTDEWTIKQSSTTSSSTRSSQPKQRVVPSSDPVASLTEVIGAEVNRKKKYPPSESGNSARNYEMFVDLVHKMLKYDPSERIKPGEALNHPFILSGEQAYSPASVSSARRAEGVASPEESLPDQIPTQEQPTATSGQRKRSEAVLRRSQQR